LAGAVGPEKPEDAARLDLQRDVVEGDLAVLVDLGELGSFHHQVAGVVRGHEAPSLGRSDPAARYTAKGGGFLDQARGGRMSGARTRPPEPCAPELPTTSAPSRTASVRPSRRSTAAASARTSGSAKAAGAAAPASWPTAASLKRPASTSPTSTA